MKTGQHVHYIDAAGDRQTATITDIVGAGKSTCKMLNLTAKDGPVTDVPHERDAEVGAAFWREVGAKALPEEERPPAKEPEKKEKAKRSRK